MSKAKPSSKAPISEAAPEYRRRRGRPRVTPPEFDNVMMALGEASRRTEIKRFRSARALSVLGADEKFAYITGPPKSRWEILAELGQFADDATIREVAGAICEHKLKVKDAIPMIRGHRNGGAAPGDPEALASEIDGVIRNYKIRHPSTTDDQVRWALWFVGLDFAEGGDKSVGEDDPAEVAG